MWKQLLVGTGVFATSVGATFFTLSNVNKSSASSSSSWASSWTSKEPVKESAGEKLLASLLAYDAMKIDGDIVITLENRDKITLNIDGQGSIADINNIALLANLNLNLAGIPLSGQLGYFSDTLTFSVDEICNFYLKTNDLMDFMEMIPTYGVSIDLPSSLSNLDTNTLLEKIITIEEDDVRTLPTGDRYYTVELGEGEEAIDIDVLADEENNIKGIKIDRLEYQSTELSLRINLNELKKDEFNVVNPLEGSNKDRYQNFKPVFTLIDNFRNLVNQNQFGLKVNASLSKEDKNIIDSEIAVNVDKENNKVGIDLSLLGEVKEDGSKNRYTLSAAYLDHTIYGKFHNVAISIEEATISDLVTYAIAQVKEQISAKINDVIENGLSSSDIDLDGLFAKIKNILKKINVNSGSFDIALNIGDFNEYLGEDKQILPTSDIILTINFDDHKITSITLSPITISDYTINLSVDFTDYQEVQVIDKDSYVKLESTGPLVESVIEFVKQKAYYIGFDIDTNDNDSSTNDLTMDGYVQLDFTGDNHYGYGSATIVDGKKYHHNLKADMYNQGNFIFSYNDKMKGKFTSDTIFGIAELVQDVINNPDDHFYELFGELLEKLNSGTLGRIIAGEYTLALEYELIDNLVVLENKTSFDLNLAIFGLDDMTLHLEIGYQYDGPNWTYVDLDYLNITNLKLGDKEVTVSIDFDKYQTSLDSTRLNQFDTYMDFSCLKTLLTLGINTSKFNYYHFTGELDISLPGIVSLFAGSIDNIGLDAKIKNDHGDVTVAISLTDIPIIDTTLFDLNSTPGYDKTNSRNAYIYYKHFEDHDKTDYWYVDRVDMVTKREQTGTKKVWFVDIPVYGDVDYRYELTRKCTNEYFLDNIIDILVKDVLGITNNTILSKLNSEDSSSSEIKYEEILSEFTYSPNKNSFYFGIDMKALTGLSIFNDLEVTVTENPTDHILDGVKVHFSMLASLIKADFTLHFEDDRAVDISNIYITSADNYVLAHINDAVDTASSATATKLS